MSKCSSYLDDLGYDELVALCRERDQGWMYNIVAGGDIELDTGTFLLWHKGVQALGKWDTSRRAMVERDADCFPAVLFLIKL